MYWTYRHLLRRRGRSVPTYFLLIALLLATGALASVAAAQEGTVQPGGSITSGPAYFKDLGLENPAWRYAAFLQGKGVVNGFPDGTFRPQGLATRAQAAKMLAILAGMPAAGPETSVYADVPREHWASGYINATTRTGFWQGYPDGTFKPDTVLTRAEVAALLLRLAGVEPSAVEEIADTPADHWAHATASECLAAGLLPPTATGFSSDAAASRVELARGLALAYTLKPERASVELRPRVQVLEPEVWLTAGTDRQPLTAPIKARAGDIIETGSRGRAELIFDDGSSLLLEPNTSLKLDRLGGYRFIGADGKEKGGVDQVEISLEKGTLFGALAANYAEMAGTSMPETPGGILPQPGRKTVRLEGALASLSPRLPGAALTGGPDLPLPGYSTEFLAGTGLAAANPEASPWYLQAYRKKVRVKVNMPWGVAGIRGTFWRNEVTETGFSTSILVGEAEITAAGRTVELAQGQYTRAAAEQPPAPPASMPIQEKVQWAQVETWVKEKDKSIRENKPMVPRQEARQIAASLLAAPPPPSEVPPGTTLPPVPAPPPPPVPPSLEPPGGGTTPPGEAGPTGVSPAPPTVTGEATIAIEDLLQEVETGQPQEPVSPPSEEGGPSGPLSYRLPVTPGTPVATPDGLVQVTVPAGVFVPEGVTLNVTSVPSLQPPPGLAPAGQIVDISFSDNWHPEVPVTIALAYTPGLPSEQVNKLAIYHLVNGTWMWEPTSHRSEGYVLADISQFSVFAVLTDTTAPAGLTVSTKDVTPWQVSMEFAAWDSSQVEKFIIQDQGTNEVVAEVRVGDSHAFSGLQPNTTYSWLVSAVDVFGNRSERVPVTFTTPLIPLAVVSTIPDDGGWDVDIDLHPTITFNRAVLPGTTYRGILLTDASGHQVEIDKEISGTRLILSPREPLAYSTAYTVTLPAGAVADEKGQELAEPYSFNFTAEDQALATLHLTGLARSTFVVGETLVLGDLTLTGVDRHGLPYDLEGKAMTWQSSDEDVATVTRGAYNEPVLVFTGLGITQVTAMVDGVVSDALEVTGQLVVTDRKEYRLGETVTILAALPGPGSRPIPGIQVAVEVRDESGRVKYVDQVTTGASGQAEIVYVLADTPISRITPGTYTVWASFRYGTEAYMATIAFTVLGSQK